METDRKELGKLSWRWKKHKLKREDRKRERDIWVKIDKDLFRVIVLFIFQIFLNDRLSTVKSSSFFGWNISLAGGSVTRRFE